MIEFRGWLEERPDPIGWENRRDCLSATRGELLWYFFPGDVAICIDGHCWKSSVGWVPLLHFALSLAGVCATLDMSEDSYAEYNFTESDSEIRFARSGEIIAISLDCDPFQGVCTPSEFREAVSRFLYRILEEIGAKYPSLLKTPLASDISERAEDILR